MTRHDIEDVYELTPLQQGMLFHGLAAPDAGTYLIQLSCTLEGPLDAAAFDDAWRRVAARQPVLRTSFHSETLQKPLQVVHRDVAISVHHEDWRAASEGDRAARLSSYLEDDRKRPIALDRAPVFRVALFRLGDERWQLLWSFPHILLEGWSASIVLREVLAACGSTAPGAATPGRPAPRYRDYVAWLQRQDAAAAERYWRSELAGFAAPTPLTLDRVAAHDGPEEYARVRAAIDPAVSERLQSLARGRRITLNTIFQGAWALLLARYAGEPDVVFGSVVSGRELDFPDIDALVGLCVNTLPARVRIDDGETVEQWLQAQQARSTEMRSFEYCSLLDIQRWSEVPRGTALFESIFVFENWAAGASSAAASGPLRVTAAESHEGGTGYPLVVEVAPGRTIRVGLSYDTRRFEREAVEQFLGHYVALLDAMATRPGARLGEVSPLAAGERERITRAWNDTAAPHDATARAHDLVLRQADATPAAEAVRHRGRSITYAELAERSGRLAAHLSALGVRPGVLVAVGVERSIDMVVAILGVMRAGGAYVPLDPAFPPDRLVYMLGDARCAVVLVDEQTEALFGSAGPTVVRVDRPGDWREEAAAAAVGPTSRDLAYVIYTSGSTGAPKGVQIPHGALVNFLEAMQRHVPLAPRDRLLAVTTLSFDIAGLELLLPLAAGASVVVADRETAADGVRLAESMKAEGITVMQATPATWRQLVDAGWTGEPGLRVLCGGESLPRELADDLLARAAELWNVYGPTETTIWSAIERVAPGPEPISIGRPIANTEIYVLDRRLEPVPPGAPGDLYIGGYGVADGYLRRPALTAERFIPDPFATDPRARLYRTGDIARYRRDGRIEWLGRGDHQVKLRGFRIELGEIEALLRQHDEVADAVAIVREDRPGDRRLVAYVVARPGLRPAATALRSHLQSRLPDYMVPSSFVTMDEWPRTPNGKIDRGALPAPDAGGVAGGYVAPRDPAEELIAGIWADVLGVARVGVHDNFFELGGHSLLATRVVSRMRAVFGTPVAIRQLFQAPTVARLAETLRVGEAVDAQVPPLGRAVGRVGPVLSFAQERLWFIQQMDPRDTTYNLARAVLLRGPLDASALERSFAELIRRHATLRTAIAARDGHPVVTIDEGVTFAIAFEDLAGAPDRAERVRARVEAETSTPFDLSRAPLLRATLLRLGADEHLLVVLVHHLVADAWSLGIMSRELGTLYGAFVRGEPSPLPELPLQFTDVAAWQRGWLQGEGLARELAHWRERLGGAPLVLELPADRPRPAVQAARGDRRAAIVPAALAESLRQLGRQQGTTLYMALLAAFEVLLARHCQADDFLVGSPIAGRTDVQVEGLVGLFANTLVIRADLRGDPTLADVLARVRAVALDAYAHQHVPFEKLVDELHPVRDLGRNPVVQAVFAYQNVPAEPLELAGLTWLPHALDTATSPFDVTLFVEDVPQGLVATFQYSKDLFDEETVARWHRHWLRILEVMVERPAQRLSSLSLVDPREARRLDAWNATARDYPRDSTIHAIFEAQVRRAPDRPALADRGTVTTYAELDRRANQLARHLRGLGLGRGARVGLCLDRSADLVVAMLGVLKAGGAYVPLDAAYPPERLAWMAADARLAGLVADEPGAGVLGDRPAIPVVRIDRDRAAIDAERGDALGHESSAADLAYVIYTSGSTGQPKGVAVPHRGVVRLVVNTDYVAVTGDDTFLAASPASFDASTFEVWGPLLNGARLAIFAERLPTPAALGDVLARERVTVLWLTSSLFNTIVDHDCQVLSPVRQLLVGGQALSVPHVRRALDALPAVRLINGYGPTESTTFACCHAIPRDLPDDAASVPIGRPIANTRAHVLDGRMQPVPAGVRGELYIGGDGLATCYLDRPALTAERFVPDPFAGTAGARLYRTGDKVYWREDGTIAFVGRYDDQVKIRGFRVEPGEVEALLRRHPAIADAAVVVRDDTGEKRLVAYWVPAGAPADPASDDVRAYLRERLPEYMVPSAVMRLDALPLTANGKVDRRRLPAPTREPDGFVTPETPLEQQVAEIWREVLGVPEVGATDNFFDAGGHSLMALRLVARVQQAFGVEVPVQHVFSAPTVREMAIVVDEARLAMDDEMARIDALLRLVEELPEGALGDLPQAGSARERAQE